MDKDTTQDAVDDFTGGEHYHIMKKISDVLEMYLYKYSTSTRYSGGPKLSPDRYFPTGNHNPSQMAEA